MKFHSVPRRDDDSRLNRLMDRVEIVVCIVVLAAVFFGPELGLWP